MPEVIVRKGEPVDRALKRLKSKLDAEGILDEVRRLRAFETPSQKSRRKAKANAKRGRTKFRFNPLAFSDGKTLKGGYIVKTEGCFFRFNGAAALTN